MAKLLLAALVIFALGSVEANPRQICINKVNFFLINKVSYGATSFCNAIRRGDLEGYVNRTCQYIAAGKMNNDLVPSLKRALNDVICQPTNQCSLKKKIQCNSVLYDNTNVRNIPNDVNRQMARFLDKVGPGLSDGSGMDRYCRMNRQMSYYNTRTKCLLDADAEIYRNCLPQVAPDLKQTLKLLFDNAYLNLGPPLAPSCPEYLKQGEDEMCALTGRQRCDTNFASAQSAVQACHTTFLTNFNGMSYPSASVLCSTLERLASCMDTAFGKCDMAILFYFPGVEVINKTLAFCTEKAPILNGDTDRCFYKLNFYIISKIVGTAADACNAVNNDLVNYVDKSCSSNAARKIKNNIIPALKKAMNDVICKPQNDRCSLKQKLKCNELIYRGSSIGYIPYDVNNQMTSFLDKVLPGLADGSGINTFCRSSKPSNFYTERSKCLQDADAKIYSDCLPYVPQEMKEALKQLFNNVYLTLGPGPAPPCAMALESQTKNGLCKYTCQSGYNTAARSLGKCMEDFIANFDGKSYPNERTLCRSAYALDKCSQSVIDRCQWIGAFFNPGIDYVRNAITPICNPAKPLMSAAKALEYSTGLLLSLLLVMKIL